MLMFVPVEDFCSSNPYIEMKWNGFNIESKCPEELLKFNVKTFSSFNNERGGTGMAYGPVNEMLKMLSVDAHEQIVYAFLQMHITIFEGKSDGSDIEKVEDELGDIIDNLDLEINLFDVIIEYIKAGNVPIADMSEAGSEPQHSKEMTFLEDEAIAVTAIAIFMKLLSPIIGAYIYKYAPIIDNEIKESHAQVMVVKVLRRRWNTLIDRLEFYINRLIEGRLKSNISMLYNGRTLEKSTRSTFDTLLVKRFVGVDLYRENGSIIKYIASCCRSSAEPHISSANSIKIISDPVESENKDEGNTSRMESESRQSSKPADVPVLIKVAANNLYYRIIDQENIDQQIIDETQAFYKRNPILLNPISVYVLGVYYGSELGGGESILLLNSSTITALASLLQYMMITNGARNLAHILTVNCGTTDRNVLSDFTFSNSWKSSSYYTECKKVFPSGFGEKEWDSKLKQIAAYLIRRNIVYHTAPAMWELNKEEPRNGKVFNEYLGLMNELMQFIKTIYLNKGTN